MTSITIDPDLCNGCQLCIGTCPYFVLECNSSTEQAAVRPGALEYCSSCGHCSAVCPQSAILVSYDGSGPLPDVSADSLPTPGEFRKLAVSRRSIRAYASTPVQRATFDEIFNTIRYAPSGMNGQSVRWLVIEDPKKVHDLVSDIIDWARDIAQNHPDHILAPLFPMIINAWDQGSDKVCHGAPHLVFAYSHKDNPVGFIDSIIAMTHLDLIAPLYGLGTCWAGIVQIALDASPDLMHSIGIPADHKTNYGMMIGYPAYSYKNVPLRNAVSVIYS